MIKFNVPLAQIENGTYGLFIEKYSSLKCLNDNADMLFCNTIKEDLYLPIALFIEYFEYIKNKTNILTKEQMMSYDHQLMKFNSMLRQKFSNYNIMFERAAKQSNRKDLLNEYE